MECWTLGYTPPALMAQQAAEAERAGWDGLLMPESQSLMGDAFVALAIAATATTGLKLGTGVTNPVIRHPAVVASAIASLQAVSGGRAVLGIGRGDSSLAHLGLAPATVTSLANFLAQVQSYLRGESVEFSAIARADRRSIGDVPMAARPDESRLLWIDPAAPKVPVDVAATGPKVIELGAVVADRLTFAVGADPDRLAWAVATARAARERAGLDPDNMVFGAYVNVVVHSDHEVAVSLAAAGVATFARLSAMHGTVTGPASSSDAAEFTNLIRSYDMNAHGGGAAKHRESVSPEFVDRFGIAGSPEQCIERLRELEAIGIRRVVFLSATGDGSPQSVSDAALSRATLEARVLPAVQEA